MKLYHYTTFATFIDYILPTKKLKFGMLKNANDPKDSHKTFIWEFGSELNLTYSALDQMTEIFYKEWDKYQYISFCITSETNDGYSIPSMWAHYGENHNGVCIEIDSEKLKFEEYLFSQPVEYDEIIPLPRYSDKPSDREISISTYNFFRKYNKQFFFKKHKCWEYEQEYRIVCYNDTSDPCYLDISDAITAVYCGSAMIRMRYDIIYLLTSKTFKLYVDQGILKCLKHPEHLTDIKVHKRRKEWAKIYAKENINLTSDSFEGDYFKKLIPRFNEIFGIEEE